MAEEAKTAPQQLLSLLTGPLRVVSDWQVAKELFCGAKRPMRVARTAIGRLHDQDLLNVLTTMAYPEHPLCGPVLDWLPGDMPPNFDKLAQKLQSRWRDPPIRTKVLWATAKAKRLYGGLSGGRGPRAKEVTHDIHVAQVYFFLRRHFPENAEHWTGEDELRAQGREGDIPDALVSVPGEEPILIDFGGSYDARKLRAIHHSYAPQGRYQIW